MIKMEKLQIWVDHARKCVADEVPGWTTNGVKALALMPHAHSNERIERAVNLDSPQEFYAWAKSMDQLGYEILTPVPYTTILADEK